MTTQSSIVGFKNPRADLHKKSPKIFLVSNVITVITVAVMLQVPFFKREKVVKTVKAPPVIIQMENIPETTQRVSAPAPKLGMPMEVSDDVMLDDVTIEDTTLDMGAFEETDVKPVIVAQEVIEEEAVEEEIFEFFAVEEQPKRLDVVAPEYPEAAQQAGIQGTVFLRALVGTNGAVEEVTVLKGPELLHNAAIAAAKKTKFSPAKQNDMPVKCWVQMRFAFELEG